MLYDDPTNLFVAGFIGSPAMNFLPAQVEGDRVKLPFGDARLDGELRSKLQSVGDRDVIAGMRPEHFEDAAVAGEDHRDSLDFRTKIDVVESMGSELYAYFDVESQNVDSAELAELAQDAGLEDVPGRWTAAHM